MHKGFFSPEFLAALRRRTALAPLVRRWGIQLRQVGRDLIGLCPVHQERTPSFTVSEEKGFVHCFGCGWHADAIDIYRRMTATNFSEAVEALAAEAQIIVPGSSRKPAGRPERVQVPVALQPPLRAHRSSPILDRIWDEVARPLVGTPAEVYLQRRCGRAPRWADLRYLPSTGKHPHPAMVGLITDFVTGERLSLHFTLLKSDGSQKADVGKPKRVLAGHSKARGVIRLVPDADVTLAIGLTEGIETGISVMVGGWSPVWAAVDAGNLGRLPVLNGIETLAIFADHDQAGLSSSSALAHRWRSAGRSAEVIVPRQFKSDWNDISMREVA